jgi:hypothetical protein
MLLVLALFRVGGLHRLGNSGMHREEDHSDCGVWQMGSLWPNIPEDLCLKAQNGFGKSSIPPF